MNEHYFGKQLNFRNMNMKKNTQISKHQLNSLLNFCALCAERYCNQTHHPRWKTWNWSPLPCQRRSDMKIPLESGLRYPDYSWHNFWHNIFLSFVLESANSKYTRPKRLSLFVSDRCIEWKRMRILVLIDTPEISSYQLIFGGCIYLLIHYYFLFLQYCL